MTDSSPSRQERCPTCGGDGPDVVDIDFDSGMPDVECGDEWHDRFPYTLTLAQKLGIDASPDTGGTR